MPIDAVRGVVGKAFLRSGAANAIVALPPPNH
jgi:hypothetical protein